MDGQLQAQTIYGSRGKLSDSKPLLTTAGKKHLSPFLSCGELLGVKRVQRSDYDGGERETGGVG